MSAETHTPKQEREVLWQAWIAGYEACAGVGFFNERFDYVRGEVLAEFNRWLEVRDA